MWFNPTELINESHPVANPANYHPDISESFLKTDRISKISGISNAPRKEKTYQLWKMPALQKPSFSW